VSNADKRAAQPLNLEPVGIGGKITPGRERDRRAGIDAREADDIQPVARIKLGRIGCARGDLIAAAQREEINRLPGGQRLPGAMRSGRVEIRQAIAQLKIELVNHGNEQFAIEFLDGGFAACPGRGKQPDRRVIDYLGWIAWIKAELVFPPGETRRKAHFSCRQCKGGALHIGFDHLLRQVRDLAHALLDAGETILRGFELLEYGQTGRAVQRIAENRACERGVLPEVRCRDQLLIALERGHERLGNGVGGTR
jgi:hypothetical protein